MRVLITDGAERAALATARSLVAAGHQVHVAAASRFALAAVTRGVRAVPVRADALRDPDRYAVEIASLVEALEATLLLPVTDASVSALLQHRATLPANVALPLPSLAAYRLASDKAAIRPYAREAGLAVPESVVLESPVSGERLWRCLPGPDFFPAVVKPHASIVGGATARQKAGVAQVADLDACHAVVAALPREAFPVLVQRRVHGPGEGLFLLRWDGRVLATFAHRRLREKPPAGGVSVYRESIDRDPDLVAAGTKLLDLLDWQGVAMIECKRDTATGRHVLIEVNGRLWGSLQLAIDAGVDFPRLLADCACGLDVVPVTTYRVGVRSRWLWGDLDHLYLRLSRSAQALQLDGGAARSRIGALRSFFRRAPQGEREEIWRWRDPAPFLVETLSRLGVLH